MHWVREYVGMEFKNYRKVRANIGLETKLVHLIIGVY